MALVKTALDDLTYKVNGLAMEVQHELKPGHPEKIYQRRLAERCIAAGYQVEMEKQVEVWIEDSLIGYMFLDLWIEQSLIVECKAFDHLLTNEDIGQVLTYLVATGGPVGMLYNFGRRTLEFKRILPPKQIQEWQKHLYRCIWIPPGHSLPSIEAIESSTPIRFSVVSAILPSFVPQPDSAPSAPIRLSVPQSVDGPSTSSSSKPPQPVSTPSAPVRLSVPQSVDGPSTSSSSKPPQPVSAPSAPVRLSASQSVDDPSTSSSSKSPQPVSAPSAPVRLSASQSVDDLYASSGVSIDAGNRAVELMKSAVKSTYGPEVLAGIGAFGGLYDAAALQRMQAPVLVASTDGVGTKVKLAAQAGRYQSIGHDIVNHCTNDILVQGARPLFFLDYFATSKLVPEIIAEIVAGISAACRAACCALLGGETAEMPGVYQPGEFDVAGTIIGIVERAEVLPRPDIRAGDVLIGLRSSGPHTNGYSLIRKIFEGVSLDTVFPELGIPLADALLAPHRSYLPLLQPILCNPPPATRHPQPSIKALAHLTGGGFIENLPRVLPVNVSAVLHLRSWPVPPLFTLIQQRGAIATEEMHRVFNMGIGMVVVVAPELSAALQSAIPEETYRIGEIIPGEKKVILE